MIGTCFSHNCEIFAANEWKTVVKRVKKTTSGGNYSKASQNSNKLPCKTLALPASSPDFGLGSSIKMGAPAPLYAKLKDPIGDLSDDTVSYFVSQSGDC